MPDQKSFDQPSGSDYPGLPGKDEADFMEATCDYTAAELNLEERQDSLVGRIAAEVARAISEGELPPGADLNSVELAARFGTSRTPVREALMLLEKEGLVEIPPRRRPRVARIGLDEIEELYQIRVELAGLMIRQFVRNADEEELQATVELYKEMCRKAEGDDIGAWLDSRRRMHDYWADHCGNESLRKLLNTWKMRMSVGRLVGPRVSDVERSMLDHRCLVLACLERDVRLASALMHSMTLSGLSAILGKHHARSEEAAGAAEGVERLSSARPQLHIV